jgi:hypothetical protein
MNRQLKAHSHVFDIWPNDEHPDRVYCLVCGFAITVGELRSKVNLTAMTALSNATDRVRDLVKDKGEAK